MLKFHAECIPCLAQATLQKISAVRDPALRLEYARASARVFAELDPEHDSAPTAEGRIAALRRDICGVRDDYSEIKHKFNMLLLSMYEELRQKVAAQPDPLYAAMQLAVAGNYIDFGAFSDVSPDRLRELMSGAFSYDLDRTEYANLCAELANGTTCAVLHDNCGEIVLDKLMLCELHRAFPHIKIVSVVRDCDILNDVTLADAREIGLFDVAEVIPNGTPGIPGTQLDELPESVSSLLQNVDAVIAKGQGNFETLADCRLNVYFLLLAKCPHYATWYGFPQFSCVLANARRIRME